jgi:hypothetical protein
MKRIAQLENQINEWDEIATEIEGLKSLLELDDGSLTEEIEANVAKWESILAEKEITILLSGVTTKGTPCLLFMRAQEEQIRRIGLLCWSACTCVGQKSGATKPKSWIAPRVKKPDLNQ